MIVKRIQGNNPLWGVAKDVGCFQWKLIQVLKKWERLKRENVLLNKENKQPGFKFQSNIR